MKGKVLITDDEQTMCEYLEAELKRAGYRVHWCLNGEKAIEVLREQEIDIVLTDIKMPGMDGISLCQCLRELRPDVPVVVMTSFGSLDTAVAAIRAGAYDFVTKPIEFEVLCRALDRGIENRKLRETVKRLSQMTSQATPKGDLIGESSIMKRLGELLGQASSTDAAVLIQGESGTGKHLVAKTIHNFSSRKSRSFVSVRCSGLPENLLESELFGYVKGAFPDSVIPKRGLLFDAQGGTLFLDDVNDLPSSLQAKLFTALQDKSARPLGGAQDQPIDVRVIASTNTDLETEVTEGRFREDLYFRLNVIPVDIPPLRVRGNDILLLAQHFVEHFANFLKKPVKGISEGVARRLLYYPWPGNVRELKNYMERAVALTHHEKISLEDLPDKVSELKGGEQTASEVQEVELVPLEEIERRHILHVLKAVGNSKTLASQILGLDRKTLYRKLERYNFGAEQPQSDK